MMKKALEAFGLSDKEARIYLAVLELGETNIERISKKSKIKRTTVYDVVELLAEKGLIGTTLKQRKHYFFATDPRELENKIEEKKTLFKIALPELLSIANLIDKKPRIKFFEGAEGIKQIFNDILKYPDQPLWAWVSDEIYDLLDRDYLDHFVARRVKNKIWAYVIISDTPKLKDYLVGSTKSLRQTKVDRSPDYKTEVEIDLYGDNRIGVMSFSEQIGLIIESRKIFNTLKSIFNAHWSRLD